MKQINDKINEGLNVSKSFVLNMKEIDYDKLIDFLQNMKEKDAKTIQISIESNGRKWQGCELGSDDKKYNCTALN